MFGRSLALLSCFALGACAPDAIPLGVSPTAPAHSAEVVPTVQRARIIYEEQGAASRKLEDQVGRISKELSESKSAMTAALAEADRLRVQQSASPAELTGLFQQLKAVQARNLFLEAEVAAAVSTADLQKNLRVTAEANLAALEKVAADRDAETATLRLQHEDMAAMILSQKTAFEAQAKTLTKAKEDAAIGGYLRTWVIVVAVCLGLFIALSAYLKFFIPRLP